VDYEWSQGKLYDDEIWKTGLFLNDLSVYDMSVAVTVVDMSS
jgi:hypothetical protein